MEQEVTNYREDKEPAADVGKGVRIDVQRDGTCGRL